MDEAAAARFRADLAALGTVPERLALAVSGGPDSLALLLLAAAAMPGRVAAATVDHGLRPESADEAAMVAALCTRLSVPHATLAVTVRGSGEGLQAAARETRYRALADWCARSGITTLATAHHADDQAETLLMRLRRGAGLAGLAGIRSMRRQGELTIVRPLLGWRKAELEQIITNAGIEPADDPSNRDPRFDRTGMRAMLAALPDFDPIPLARSAAVLQEAEVALVWMAERLWEERVRQHGPAMTFDPEELPAELRRRLVARILRAPAPEADLRGEAIGRLIARLERGETATLAGVMARPGARWTFAPAPARRTAN